MHKISVIRHGILIAVIFGMACFSGITAAEEAPGSKKQHELKPQATCPAMGGKINKQLYVDANGKRIYVCCKGCVEIVKKDPDAALAKLAKLGEQAEDTPLEQTTCPVMGGAINKELYVEHEGKKLYVCCQSCLDAVKKDPAKYAKKIAEQIVQNKAKAEQDASAAKTLSKEIVWTCSMHPNIRKDKPGKCPICGMDLIVAKQAAKAESEEPEKTPESTKPDDKQKDAEHHKQGHDHHHGH